LFLKVILISPCTSSPPKRTEANISSRLLKGQYKYAEWRKDMNTSTVKSSNPPLHPSREGTSNRVMISVQAPLLTKEGYGEVITISLIPHHASA